MQNEDLKTITAAVTPEYIKKTLKFNGSEVVRINLKYPGIKISPAGNFNKSEKKINNYYDLTIRSFIKYCEKILYKNAAPAFAAHQKSGGGFKPFGAVITFETAYNRQDFLSIYLDINIYFGKGRGNAIRKAQIWKIDDGELLPPERFIKFTRPVKIKICGHICGIIAKQIENGGERCIKSDMPSVCRDVYKYLDLKNFYPGETGYTFFFPQGTIAPPENGIVSFAVPEKIIRGG